MSKILTIDDMLQALYDIADERGTAERVNFEPYNKAVVIAEKAALDIAAILANYASITLQGEPDWQGKAFGGLCAAFETGPKGETPEQVAEQDPGGEWGEDDPEECECDNTHEQNDTVCRYCWGQGLRKWSNHPREAVITNLEASA